MKTLFFGFAASLFAILLPITPFIYLVGLFIMIDTFCALIYARAHRKPNKQWFYSHKFFNFAVKIAFYATAILASFGIDQIILGGDVILGVKLLVTKIITMLFITNEMISVNETYQKHYKESILTTLKRWMKQANGVKKDLKAFISDDDDKKEVITEEVN